MAPSAPPAATVIQPWEVFTAFDTDGHPLVGGKLYTYQANTTMPKASYADPYLTVPNPNPVVLDSQGQAIVWLDGVYHLRLENAEGEQLWDVLAYEFQSSIPAPTAGTVSGYNEVTVSAVNGAGVISVNSGVPLGYRVKGSILRNDTAWGTSNGLTSILIGDSTANDRWGSLGLDAGLSTGQQHFRNSDQPIAATPYTVLLSAIGGTFDTVGTATIRTFWESITAWS